MATDPNRRLEELGLSLPPVPAPAADYTPFRVEGGLVFTAGQLPTVDGELRARGKLGAEIDVERGQELARLAALNVLAVGAGATGGLEGLRVIKLTVFVASTPGFTEQHLVANGASGLMADVLGDDGVHARSAVGVPVLPLDAPVEIEAILSN